jgi:hypothetical protein
VTISLNAIFELDLNHDGSSDFALNNFSTSFNGFIAGLSVNLPPTNGIWGKNHQASALPAGIRIGPGGPFSLNQSMAEWRSVYNSYRGQWAKSGQGVRNRYLGLKFLIEGKVHFGWARLTVKVQRGFRFPRFAEDLTGYAYETIPGKGIIAGKTKGADVVIMPMDTRAGTLGHLSAGKKVASFHQLS